MATERPDKPEEMEKKTELLEKNDDKELFIELPAPKGWTKKYFPNKGQTPRKSEIKFISPTGEEILSRKQLDQFLKSHPGGPSSSQFDWGTGDSPRRSSRLIERQKPIEAPGIGWSQKRKRKSSSKGAAKVEKEVFDGEGKSAGVSAPEEDDGGTEVEMNDAEEPSSATKAGDVSYVKHVDEKIEKMVDDGEKSNDKLDRVKADDKKPGDQADGRSTVVPAQEDASSGTQVEMKDAEKPSSVGQAAEEVHIVIDTVKRAEEKVDDEMGFDKPERVGVDGKKPEDQATDDANLADVQPGKKKQADANIPAEKQKEVAVEKPIGEQEIADKDKQLEKQTHANANKQVEEQKEADGSQAEHVKAGEDKQVEDQTDESKQVEQKQIHEKEHAEEQRQAATPVPQASAHTSSVVEGQAGKDAPSYDVVVESEKDTGVSELAPEISERKVMHKDDETAVTNSENHN